MTYRPAPLHTVGTRLTREDGELLDAIVSRRGLDGAARDLGLTRAMVVKLTRGGHASAPAVERVAEKLAAYRAVHP